MHHRSRALTVATSLLAAVFSLHAGAALAQEACTKDASSPPFWDPAPPDTVQFFDSTNYTGNCTRLRLNQYPHTGYPGLGDFGWNDRVVSVEIGPNVRVKMFADWRFTGTQRVLVNDTPDLFNLSGEFSSARIESLNRNTDCSNLNENEVAFFGLHDQSLDCYILNAFNVNLGQAYSLYLLGLANDSNYRINNQSERPLLICEHDNCAGAPHENYTIPPGQDLFAPEGFFATSFILQ
jgi:hypothetical protein